MAYTAAGLAMPKRTQTWENITVKPKHDDDKTIKTVQWMGSKDIRVVDSPMPLITDPGDVVIKVTSSCICGSDLHLYLGAMPGMKRGDIMGHETLGIIVDVGPEVTSFRPGDRVVVAFDIACGHCFSCQHQDFSGCDNTNPSTEQEMLYQHRSCGMFGYSHLTGGYEGGQAEMLRVPLAEQNCIKVPPASELPDEKVVLLSDILSTAWHANELGGVQKGDNVAIWGAGPVGILAAHVAQVRGANTIVLIDKEQYRLDYAKERIPGIHTINFEKRKTLSALKELFNDEKGRYTGPDVSIEAVGFHYCHSFLHWVEMALKLENDPSEILNELIYATRKGGRIAVVGVYSGFANHLNIGAFMEKGLSMHAGQTPVQKYWKLLLSMIQEGKLQPEMVITHQLPLSKAPEAYKMFNEKQDGCIKVVLKPELDSH